MINPPDLILLTAQIQADDATRASAEKTLALIQVEAFLMYIQPHVPIYMREEYLAVCGDVQHALGIDCPKQ